MVGLAGLAGVLNPMPSLGFLHSLERALPPLETELGAVGEAAAAQYMGCRYER